MTVKRDYIYLIIIAILLIGGYIVYNRLQDEKVKSKGLTSALSEKNAKIEILTNSLGETIFRKQAAELRVKDLEKAYPELAATLEKQFDVKMKNLKAYIENQFQVHGTGTGTVTNNHYYDSASKKTVKFRDFNMDDGYLTFETRLYDSLSNALYKYTYNDTAKTVIASDKKFFQFWKNEKLFATTKFSNPNSAITGATNILVNDYKDKRFSVSISAGWGLVKVGNEVHTGFFGGPSVSYSLFKF